jgi:hypothetical protein
MSNIKIRLKRNSKFNDNIKKHHQRERNLLREQKGKLSMERINKRHRQSFENKLPERENKM